MVRTLLGALLLVVVTGLDAFGASALRLDGPMVQGGLVQGSTAVGTRVTVNGRTVKVSKEGLFVFGFSRDAPAIAVLVTVYPEGREETRKLEVRRRTYNIQRIDGLPSRKVTPSAEDLKRIRKESRSIHAARARYTDAPGFRQGFIWPVKGIVSGVYGSQRILNGQPRRPHLGLDIAAPKGTPVVATADGVVALAHADMFFTGGTVIIDHGLGVNSIYSHLSEISVKRGDRVAQGAPIGAVGSTGRSTGPHLDWRVNLYQTQLDPALLVGPMPR